MSGSTPSISIRMPRMFLRLHLSPLLFGALLFAAAPLVLSAAQSSESALSSSVVKEIPYTPGLKMADLVSATPDDRVVFKSGRSMSVRDLRRLEGFQQKLKAAKASNGAASLRLQPNAGNVKATVATRSDLSRALQLPDGDTVRLPSGKLVTAKVLKMAYGLAEQRIRNSASRKTLRPVPQGPALKVTASKDQNYWRNVLQKPDDTVLESPGGKRITVGELKSYMEQFVSLRDSAAHDFERGRK